MNKSQIRLSGELEKTKAEVSREIADAYRKNQIGSFNQIIIRLFSIGAQVIKFLTSPPGNLIIFSLATVYFALISVESYWLAVDKMNEAFVPKPFIDDGAAPRHLGVAIRSMKFWASVMLSLFVQSVQAFVIREIRIEVQQNINASQKSAAIRGAAIVATYVIDGRVGLASAPRQK